MLAIIMAIENDEERHFIERIYENYKYAMFRVAYAVLKDSDKAEDAVSSAFEKIIKHVGKYKTIPDEKIKGLVVIVVRNISINMLKHDNLIEFVKLSDNMSDPDTDTEIIVTQNYEYAVIMDAISRLDEKYLSVMGLKYFQGYSDAKIAELLDISHENVRVRLHRARQRLNAMLEDERNGK